MRGERSPSVPRSISMTSFPHMRPRREPGRLRLASRGRSRSFRLWAGSFHPGRLRRRYVMGVVGTAMTRRRNRVGLHGRGIRWRRCGRWQEAKRIHVPVGLIGCAHAQVDVGLGRLPH